MVLLTVTFYTALTFVTVRMTSSVLLGLALSFTARRIVPLRLIAVRTRVWVRVTIAIWIRAALRGTATGCLPSCHHLLKLSDRNFPGHYLPQELQCVIGLYHLCQMFVVQRGSLVTLHVCLFCQVMYEEFLQRIS